MEALCRAYSQAQMVNAVLYLDVQCIWYTMLIFISLFLFRWCRRMLSTVEMQCVCGIRGRGSACECGVVISSGAGTGERCRGFANLSGGQQTRTRPRSESRATACLRARPAGLLVSFPTSHDLWPLQMFSWKHSPHTCGRHSFSSYRKASLWEMTLPICLLTNICGIEWERIA